MTMTILRAMKTVTRSEVYVYLWKGGGVQYILSSIRASLCGTLDIWMYCILFCSLFYSPLLSGLLVVAFIAPITVVVDSTDRSGQGGI